MNDRDKQWLGELAREHETPFWVLLPRVSQSHYFELLDALQKITPSVHICYSVKTNPHEKIVGALSRMESGFECVSLRELKVVQPFGGVKLFNSCGSSEEELKEALSQNALIILDSLSQADDVEKWADKKPLNVGLRVRLDHHRFGFSPTEIRKTIEQLAQKGLHVTVLHSHPGTNCSLNSYRTFISRFAAVVIDYPFLQGIDIGGGFPGKTSLIERKETLAQYVQIIQEQLGDFLKTRTLYVECGRFLVEDSMLLVTQVKHLKNVEGQSFAILDAGINILPRISMNPFRFFALTENGAKKSHVRLAGPLMFGSDEWGQVFASLGKGDLIAVENTGAYCTELGWKLSRDFPEIVVVE